MSKPHHASPRFFVPEGFSGWWCERCVKPVMLDEELGSPARCPKCHKPTAVWIPPSAPVVLPAPVDRDHRPKAERAGELFAHIKQVIEQPDTEPDLRKIEDEEYKR